MKYQTLQNFPRLLVVVCFAAFLAGCSSSSTTDPQTGGDLPGDINGDGIVDLAEGDHNGDGVLDNSDLDFNGDTFVDELDDINGDGENNFLDFDVDGDGFTDSLDDINGDGVINSSDAAATGPTNGGPCEGGDDRDSSDANWDNNCFVSVNSSYKDSSYSRGIQQILWCQGLADGAERAAFTDGSYGNNTEAAVIRFQQAESITPQDGIVGPITWGVLQDQLEVLNDDGTTTAYGVISVDCNGQAQFFQDNISGSWRIANEPGGVSADSLEFSTGF
ncbi:MAG: peptidoglycan-binding protein [Granulosicoccaceae bacterium]